MEAIGAISGLITVVEVSVRITAICLKYSKGVKNADADIQRLQKTIQHLRHTSESVLELLRGPDQWRLRASQKLLQATEDSRERLHSLEEKLQPSSTRGKFMRLGLSSFKWPFEKKDMERLVTELSQCSQAISAALQVDQLEISLQTSHDISKIDRSIQEMDKRTLLDRLAVVHGAAFNSQAEEHNALCLPETRVDNIHQILEWVSDPESPSLFWLKGMAGTGKSTISRTIAYSLDARGMLGSSFFFNRVEGDRSSISKLFATLAFQLSIHDGQVAKQLISALDKDPSIPTKTSKDQFEKMILEPLRLSYPPDSKTVIVIILDALDECSNHNDARNVINLFSKARMFGIRLRVFITSRPELLLRLGFNEANCDYQSMDLSETPEITIQQDIARYFETELARIRTEYNARVADDRRLTEDWPGERHARDLIEMAIPLFIFAATVCRFLAEIRWEPDEQLVKVLNYQSQSPVSKLDATYAPVLNQLIDGLSESEAVEVVSDFQQIVGSIIILEDSLSTSVLSQLLDVPRRKIDRCLDMLHSVLSVPASSMLPVRLLHGSFRDYLLDPKMKGTTRFWIDKATSHRTLTKRCLYIMNDALHEDMCELRVPGTLRKTVEQTQINDRINPVLQYACKYWVSHFIQSQIHRHLVDQVYEFVKVHFLHWVEVLSLLGEVQSSSAAVEFLQTHLLVDLHLDLDKFLSHAALFIRRFYEAIDTAPLQLYSSALMFCPQKSLIRQFNEVPKWITLPPLMPQDWDPYLLILEGHKRSVRMAIMSPDSSFLAACTSGNEIWIWNTEHGVLKTVLKGHTNKVTSIAFTADSTHIASHSQDHTVRLWDINEGICRKIYPVYSDKTIPPPHPVVVLDGSDGAVVARTRHEDGTCHVWRVDNGQLIRKLDTVGKEIILIDHKSRFYTTMGTETTLHLHDVNNPDKQRCFAADEPITNGAIAADLSMVAVVHVNRMQIWKIDPKTILRTLEGHERPINNVTFSPDSRLLVSGAWGGGIRVWNLATGQCIRTLVCFCPTITSLEFSIDSSTIIVASDDLLIRTWRSSLVKNDELSPDLQLNTRIVCVNPHLQLVVGLSQDLESESKLYSSIRIWSLATGEQLHGLAVEDDEVVLADAPATDSDDVLIVAAYESQVVRVWSASTAKCVYQSKCDRLVQEVRISNDAKTIACLTDGGWLELHDMITQKCARKFNLDQGYHSLRFQQDGQLFIKQREGLEMRMDPNTGGITAQVPLAASEKQDDFDCDDTRRWITWRGHNILHVPLSYYWRMTQLHSKVRDDEASLVLRCNENGGILVFRFSVSQLDAMFQ